MKDLETNIVEEATVTYGKTYTYADYLNFEFEEMVELIRGKVFRMSPAPKAVHQRISLNLVLAIGNYLSDKSCQVYHAPFDVILPIKNEKKNTATTVVQPDICVICNDAKINEAGCLGAPDWIIEILSKSTSKKDLQDKYSIYEEAGVKEYWIVMPNEKLVSVFYLEDGKYQRMQTYIESQIVSPVTFPYLEIDLMKVFVEKKTPSA